MLNMVRNLLSVLLLLAKLRLTCAPVLMQATGTDVLLVVGVAVGPDGRVRVVLDMVSSSGVRTVVTWCTGGLFGMDAGRSLLRPFTCEDCCCDCVYGLLVSDMAGTDLGFLSCCLVQRWALADYGWFRP